MINNAIQIKIREIFKIIRKVEVTDNNRIVTEVESWDDLHPAENLF